MSNLGVIRGHVRNNLGERVAQFYRDQELNQYIGEAFKFATLLCQQAGDGFFETTINLGFIAGVETVSVNNLALEFKSQSRLQRNNADGSTIPLQFNEQRFVPNNTLFTGAGNTYLPRWYFRGTNLVLWPTPQNTEAATSTTGLKLDYVYVPACPDTGTADNFTFDASFPTIYEPVIELYATIAALEAKDGMGGVADVQSFRGRLEDWKGRLIDSISREESPDRVQYMGNDYRNLNNGRY